MRNRRNRRISNNNSNKILKIIILILVIFSLITFISTMKNKKANQNNNNLSDKTKIENKEISNNENTSITNDDGLNSLFVQTPEEKEQEEAKKNKNSSFTMAITGDIMCHNTIYQDAKTKSKYDFSYIFDDVKYYLQTADITVGNLETTFAGSKVGYSSYPKFNTPEALAKNLKKAGFDVLSTANNHCLDTGYKGIESTIKYLDQADISHTGTYTSKKEQKTILIKNVKGIKIAFLSFTYGTNGIPIPKGKEYCVNLNTKKNISQQLKLAKQEDPDIICVSMHWGTKYETSQNKTQKELADYLFENGVDIIIGNHPHVLQPMEKRTIKLNNGTKKQGFIVYSLGNFLADQSKSYTRDTVILNLQITKKSDTNNITIDSATYTPVYIYNNKSASKKKFKLLDIEKEIESYEAGYNNDLGKYTYNTLVTELKNIKKIIGKEIK